MSNLMCALAAHTAPEWTSAFTLGYLFSGGISCGAMQVLVHLGQHSRSLFQKLCMGLLRRAGAHGPGPPTWNPEQVLVCALDPLALKTFRPHMASPSIQLRLKPLHSAIP